MSIKKEYVSLSKKVHFGAGGLQSFRVDLTSENDFDAICDYVALFFVIASSPNTEAAIVE